MAEAEFFGFNPPFIGGSQGIMSRQEDIRLIKNDILQLLLTAPGDRVMRPTFGVNIRNAVFEPSDVTSYTNIRSSIKNALALYEPRVIVEKIDIIEHEDNRIEISIVTRLKKDPSKFVNVQTFIESKL